MAATERAVRKVIEVARVTIRNVPASPTFPTTHPNLKYMMTPRIVRIDGVKTPANVPSPVGRSGLTTLARRPVALRELGMEWGFGGTGREVSEEWSSGATRKGPGQRRSQAFFQPDPYRYLPMRASEGRRWVRPREESPSSAGQGAG